MPPERHSGPPRPPRDRYSGPPSFGGPRRSFGGPPGGHSGPPREGGPRPPFTPRPTFSALAPAPAQPTHTVRLRDGDREVEVSGTPDFVRSTLDDLPALLARLRGETPAPARPASISMPPPPPAPAADLEDDDDDEPPAPRAKAPAPKAPALKAERVNGRVRHARNGASLEDRVFDALAHADHPLSVAGIRKQLGGTESGQQIRRILERAADRVYTTDERPAAYALR